MGKGIVDALKKEFDIEDHWMSYEIHPETPAEGVAMEERFPKSAIGGMYDRLRISGKPYGIEFGEWHTLSNSHLALAASEFARDHGKFHAFHEAIFRAYFTEGKDIGDWEVIRTIAKTLDLDTDELKHNLDSGAYESRLSEASERGSMYGVTGTPTFIINGRYKVVGAQPLEAFRNALKQIQNESQG